MSAVSALLVLVALAAPAPSGEAVTEVCATQIEATGNRAKSEKPAVDAKLEKISGRLPGRYASYKWLAEQCWKLKSGESCGVALVKPYRMRLERLDNEEGQMRVGWGIAKEKEGISNGVGKFANHGMIWVAVDEADLLVLLHAHWPE